MQIKSKNSLLVLLLLPVLASAAGIGKINVKSALGEPLNAEVEVFVTDSNELDLAVARLGSMQDYVDAGIADAFLGGVNANIIKKSNGRYAIELQSNQAVNEPFLELLVKLDTKTSNLMRQYTVLLDPPLSALHEEFNQDTRVNPNPINKKNSKKSRSSEATRDDKPSAQLGFEQNSAIVFAKPSEETAKPVSASSSTKTGTARITDSGQTYVAQAGDVFGKIAQRYQPEGVPLVKVMAAFYALNKNAFIDGDMHKLKAGSEIRIPDQETLNNAGQLKSSHHVAKQDQSPQPISDVPAKEPKPTRTEIKEARLDSKPPVADMLKAEPTPAVDKNVSENPVKGDLNYVLKVSPGDTSVNVHSPAPVPNADVANTSKDDARQVQNAAPSQAGGAEGQSFANPSQNKNGLAAAANNSGVETSFAQTLQNYWMIILIVLGLFLIALLAWFGHSKKRGASQNLRNQFSPIFGEEILPIEPSVPASSSAFAGLVTATNHQQTNTDKLADSLLADTVMSEDELKREFLDPSAESNPKPVDPLIEAELFMTYGRHKQAETILTSVDTPYKLELSLGLLKIYADRKDKVAFDRIVHSIHDDLNSGSIEEAMIWSKVVALGSKLDPANPLYAGAAKVNKLSARERAAAAERAVRENLMPLDPDGSASFHDMTPTFETFPEISPSKELATEPTLEPMLETEPEASRDVASVEFEQIKVPEKTNEIEFTLEDMKMPELSGNVDNFATDSTERLSAGVESDNNASALFAKLKDEK